MTISYTEALELLRQRAIGAASKILAVETIPVTNAVGRVAATPCLSPRATPVYSTSAMDGFLICSSATNHATPHAPAIFIVVGTVVPGQGPPKCTEAVSKGARICLEVMTGGQFPETDDELKDLDACVPVEHVSLATSVHPQTGQATKSIIVTRAVSPGAHRRMAGTDLTRGQPLVTAGQRILSSHLLPLVSAGVESISVLSGPRVGIWSTGNELVSHTSNAPTDVNGPYLTALCRDFGADPVFLGYLDDDRKAMAREFANTAESGRFAILVTTGAVSAGKFDFVRPALTSCGADISFHGVGMRPGHPVLFASLPSKSRAGSTAFFALPGNPGAAAACFRFLLVPYLRQMQRRDPERPVMAHALQQETTKPQQSETRSGSIVFSPRGRNDYFVPGRLTSTADGRNVVEVCAQTCPAKLGPFVSATAGYMLLVDAIF